MGAVDHIVRRAGAGAVVDLLDRVAEGLAGREAPVDLCRERDHDVLAQITRRLDDSHRLVGVVHGQRRHHVSLVQRGDLRAVIVGRLLRRHRRIHAIAVATWPDLPRNHGRHPGKFGLDVPEELDGIAVDAVERRSVVADRRAPVGVGAPGRGFEHQAEPVLPRDVGVLSKVSPQPLATIGLVEKDEGGEGWQLAPVGEDERRLEPTVGQVANGRIDDGLHRRSPLSGSRPCPRRRDHDISFGQDHDAEVAARHMTAVIPPSTTRTWPLTNEAAGEARKTAAPTSSATSPQRACGVRFLSQPSNAGSLRRSRLISVAK